MKKLLGLIVVVVLAVAVFQSGTISLNEVMSWGSDTLTDTVDALADFFTGLQARMNEGKADILLVNASHPLPEDYSPGELVRLYDQSRTFQLARADLCLTSETFAAAERMFAAAAKDGLTGYIITSAHRTREAQTQIYEESDPGLAQQPGCSEHETGMAFDVTVQRSGGGFEDTPHYKWLMAHCHEYGFIQRYPEGKESITGISYEPWHYRYVGEKAARAIHLTGRTLEEYLD